jgi:hypothetical protein
MISYVWTMISSRELFFWTVNRHDMDYDIIGLEYDITVNIIVNIMYDIIGII